MLTGASERRAEDAMNFGVARFIPFVVLAEVVALYAPTAAWLYGRWTMSVWHNAHGLLIPFVVAYFVYQELKVSPARHHAGHAWGLLALLPALALQAVDAGLHTQLLSAISLVLALPGLALLFLGWERTKAIAFPLAFSAFMLPIPLSFTERIHMWLRQIATFGTESAMSLLGIPVLADGTTLHFASTSLMVSDACSGFSTLYAALAVACLTAYSAPSAGRRLMVLLAAAPLAVGANVLRVILLSLIVLWKGPWVLDTFIHPLSGMLTFVLALPVIFWLGQPAPAAAPAVLSPAQD
jgi:exosortase